eukprot:4925-Chlamydomonas_euryale.AAC.7
MSSRSMTWEVEAMLCTSVPLAEHSGALAVPWHRCAASCEPTSCGWMSCWGLGSASSRFCACLRHTCRRPMLRLRRTCSSPLHAKSSPTADQQHVPAGGRVGRAQEGRPQPARARSHHFVELASVSPRPPIDEWGFDAVLSASTLMLSGPGRVEQLPPREQAAVHEVYEQLAYVEEHAYKRCWHGYMERLGRTLLASPLSVPGIVRDTDGHVGVEDGCTKAKYEDELSLWVRSLEQRFA